MKVIFLNAFRVIFRHKRQFKRNESVWQDPIAEI
jgi:hypothetical protein